MPKSFEAKYFSGKGSHYLGYTYEEMLPYAKAYLKLVKQSGVHRGKLLEVGCAKGFVLMLCDKSGYQTYGIDISKTAIKAAKKYTKAKLFCQSAEERYPFSNNFFDIVVIFETIEHLKNPIKALKEIYRVLKKDGIVIVTTPNKLSFRRFLGIFFSRFRDRDVTHISVKASSEWKKIFNKIGFELGKVISLHFVGKERINNIFPIDIDKILPYGKDSLLFYLRK